MNLGIPLIVIFIFLVIWIVTNVIRAQQDASQSAAARRPYERPVGASPPLPMQKGNSDIDRFLQEIDRLRKKGQPDTVSAAPKSAMGTTAGTTSEQQRPRPIAPPKRPQPERKKASSSSERRPTSPLKPALPLAPSPPPAPPPVLEPDAPKPVVVSRLETKLPDVQSPARIAAPSRPSRPAQAGAAISPALQMLQTLFQSGQGAGVAVILHEIFSEPKCHRKSQMPRGS